MTRFNLVALHEVATVDVAPNIKVLSVTDPVAGPIPQRPEENQFPKNWG